jgi:methylated-DNA-protein-cysteine methyltransferase related protein
MQSSKNSKPKKKPVAKAPVEKPRAIGKLKDESFFELVFDVVRLIPKGRATSYGAIAACLGTRLSARMVGWAMNASHLAKPAVPAHRVVNRNGMLSGKPHFSPPERMQQLLEKEGIKVENDTIVDFKKIFWDPVTEII